MCRLLAKSLSEHADGRRCFTRVIAACVYLAISDAALAQLNEPILLKKDRPAAANAARRASKEIHRDYTAPDGFCCKEPKFLVAMGELLALQVMPNYFNGEVSDDSTAVIGLKHWYENSNEGFEWDDNGFTTNMFMHPYHGNVFFNAGRSNGYSFWSSALFAAGGSFLWEMYGENNAGSINDWIATSLGGIMIGEAFHRAAKMLRDNENSGPGRSLQEFGAFLIDPVGGFNRAVRGETSRVGPNPADRNPESKMIQVATGLMSMRGDQPPAVEQARDMLDTRDVYPYIDLTLQYGDWFRNYDTPFASFQLATQINIGRDPLVGELTVDGTLWGSTLKEDAGSMHTVSANQRFIYVENPALKFGGPFSGGTLNSHFHLSDTYRVDSRVQPMFAIMTGVDRDYDDLTGEEIGPGNGRDYDFGTGLAASINSTLYVDDYPILRLEYFGVYTETINGVNGYHFIHSPSARLRLRLTQNVGVGFDYIHWIRDSNYEDKRFPDEHNSVPTVRMNLHVSALDNIAW